MWRGEEAAACKRKINIYPLILHALIEFYSPLPENVMGQRHYED